MSQQKISTDLNETGADLRTIQRTKVNISLLDKEIEAIQSLEAVTNQEKTAKFLELLTALTNAAASAYFYIGAAGELITGPRVVSKQALGWHANIIEFLQQAAHNAIQSQHAKLLSLPSKHDVTVIVSPKVDPGGQHSAIVQLFELDDEPVESFVVISQLFLNLLANQQSVEKNKQSAYLDTVRHVLNTSDDIEAQVAVVDTISTLYSGMVSWLGQSTRNAVQLKVISKASSFNKRGQYANVINNAMTECKKVNNLILIDDSTQTTQSPILQNLYNILNKKHIALLPLASTNKDHAYVLGLACDDSALFEEALEQFIHQDLLLGDALSNKTHGMFARLQRLRKKFNAEGNPWFKRAAITAPVLLIALMILPVSYKINSPIVVEPLEKRFIAVPFNGVLKDVHIEPGDIIQQDQVLAELDEREMQWEFAQLQAKYESAIKQKDIDMAKDDTAAMQLSSLEASQFKAKIDLLKYQLNHLKITSPISGQLVSGDIKNRMGSAVTVGDNLFEIAPLDRVSIEIEVPAEEISYVEKNMPVELRINALPSENWNGHVQIIHLRSSMRQGSNVFIAETELENKEYKMRPGMDGHAKILAGKKALGWILFHRAWNKLIEFIFW